MEEEKKEHSDLDYKLQKELSFKDNKEDVKKVVENAIEIKVGGMTAQNQELLNELVEDKASILKEQSKAEIKINKHKTETETTEAITQKDRAFFERNKELLAKANITSPCAKSYMKLMLCITIPIVFLTNLLSLCIKVPFEIMNVFANSIDLLFTKIASFSKSARVIAISLLVMLGAFLVVFLIYYALTKFEVIS